MRERCTAGPASARPSRCTFSGIFPEGIASVSEVQRLAARYGVQPGSINPNVFQDQIYKYGSFGNPDPASGRKR